MAACPTSPDKTLPLTYAACTGTALDSGPGSGAIASGGPQAISLSADNATLASRGRVILAATATSSVSGLGGAVEIFDTTAGLLVGACGENSRCVVAYAADAGTHVFQAYYTQPTTELPSHGAALSSNAVAVTWLKSTITADNLLAKPQQSVVVTATSTMDVQPSGRWLEIYDVTTHSPVTYCTRGTVCMASINAIDGASHMLVSYVTGTPDAVSPPVSVTWLSVKLTATALSQQPRGPIYLQATVNADLAGSDWLVSIYDSSGRLIGHPCNSGRTCTATTTVGGATGQSYAAIVTGAAATMPSQGGRVELGPNPAGAGSTVIARSAVVKPAPALWGVDSCKAFTTDPSGATGLYRQVASMLGTPDFWGRYLTDTMCPGISEAEIAAAAHLHMAMLPIYDDYDCSAVRSYGTGLAYAEAATAAAQRLGIPLGVGLAVDIEPPGPQCPGAGGVDRGFVEGWHDGVSAAGYVPVYYGNGTAGSAFANAWCAAVSDRADISADSFLWSFEPSLLPRFRKATAPQFAPYAPPCDGTMAAWQYRISTGSTPDVDHDLAQPSMPLWRPSSSSYSVRGARGAGAQ